MTDLQAFQKQLAEDIEAVREMQRRQPGCPVEDCSACKANTARVEASERVIRLAQAAATVLAERGRT